MDRIYVIEQVMLDPMENQVGEAIKYKTLGFTDDKKIATAFCKQGRVFTPDHCWAITGQIDEYRLIHVNRIHIGD